MSKLQGSGWLPLSAAQVAACPEAPCPGLPSLILASVAQLSWIMKAVTALLQGSAGPAVE